MDKNLYLIQLTLKSNFMKNLKEYKYQDKITFHNKCMRFIWNFVYILLFKSTPRGNLFNPWRKFLLVMFGSKIGKYSKISPSCKIWAPWNLQIGDYTAIDDDVYIYSMDKIIIGSKVAISKGTFLCTGTHEVYSLKRDIVMRPISISDHVWIASECFVHPGINIGEGSIIGARSVVSNNIGSWVICSGNPCIEVKRRIII